MTDMPRYRSHKEVHALKIGSIHHGVADQSDMIALSFEGGSAKTFERGSIFARYMPVPGDYYVVYSRGTLDEYESFSPAKAFEEGYTRIDDNDPVETLALEIMHGAGNQISLNECRTIAQHAVAGLLMKS